MEDTRTLKELTLDECKAFAAQQDDWEWVVSMQWFKKKVFIDTEIIIYPGWSFGGWKVSSKPRLMVQNKTFTKATKLCDVMLYVWTYWVSTYYRDYKDINIYNDLEFVEKNERAHWLYQDELPEVIKNFFAKAISIFNTEFDFSSEENFLRSAIETDQERLYDLKHNRHMTQLHPEAQAILRLLLDGDEDYAKSVMTRYAEHGGGHRRKMPKILPHLDEIKAMSPYLK